MKVSPTLMFLLGACAVFVLSPYIPSWILNLTAGTMVGSLFMLVAVLVVLQGDIVLGLATFLAVAALFLEHRRRTVVKVSALMTPENKPLEIKELDTPAPDLVPGEKHPLPKQADIEDYGFEPTDETGGNKFDRVDDTQDDKHPPLETVPSQPREVSEMFQGKGLAAI
jgi:hypothetical protein